MKKFVLFLFVFTAFALNSQSQNDTTVVSPQPGKKKACFKLASTSIDMGLNKYRVIKHDDNGFSKNNRPSGKMGSMMGDIGGNMLSKNELTLELGLNPYCKKLGDYNKKQELVIGLFYSGSNLEDRNTVDYATIPGDTFSFNSVIYQTDTLTRTEHSYRIAANVLGASLKYLFKTDPEKRFTLFTGVGINAAYALTTRVHEKYMYDTSAVVGFYGTESKFDEFDNGALLASSEVKTSIKGDPTIFTSVYIPFGISIKLCKKKEIWNQMNIFMQGRVGLETEIVVKGKTNFNPFMGCSLGFKFDFK